MIKKYEFMICRSYKYMSNQYASLGYTVSRLRQTEHFPFLENSFSVIFILIVLYI